MLTTPSTIPLRQGQRALVTRPRTEADAVVAALAARGIGAIVEPLLEVHYRTAAPIDLAGAQAVLCTSANGVRALAQASRERLLPLLAVGDATAACARAEGFADVESAAGAVAELAALATARLRPEGGRLVQVAGSEIAGDLAGALRERGFGVDRVVLYEARPAAALTAATVRAFGAGMIDFALFFSPRTAAVFARLAAAARIVEELRTVAAVSISPAADAALAQLPWRDRNVAASPNQAALLTALDRAVAERRPLRALAAAAPAR